MLIWLLFLNKISLCPVALLMCCQKWKEGCRQQLHALGSPCCAAAITQQELSAPFRVVGSCLRSGLSLCLELKRWKRHCEMSSVEGAWIVSCLYKV